LPAAAGALGAALVVGAVALALALLAGIGDTCEIADGTGVA
jgi:hypothetical protein